MEVGQRSWISQRKGNQSCRSRAYCRRRQANMWHANMYVCQYTVCKYGHMHIYQCTYTYAAYKHKQYIHVVKKLVSCVCLCVCARACVCMCVCLHVHVCTCSSTFTCGEIALCGIFGKSLPACNRLLRCLLQTLHRASEKVHTGTRKKGGGRERNGKNVDKGKN